MSNKSITNSEVLLQSLFRGKDVSIWKDVRPPIYHYPNLEFEEAIIWLYDPKQFPFCRIRIVCSRTRTRPISTLTEGIVLGYSTLSKATPVEAFGIFPRRVFILEKNDLKADCIYRTSNTLPVEGVIPLSVHPGYWGDINHADQ